MTIFPKAVLLLLCCFLIAALCPAVARPTDAEDRAALRGRWQAVEASSNGEPPPPGMLEKITLVFDRETVSIMGAPPTRFKLDTTVTPAHIDFLNSRNQVGIYELRGDSLKLCVGVDGDRPKNFKTEPGTDRTYMLLKRASE